MDLSEHWTTPGGDWLNEGDHHVMVKAAKVDTAKSGKLFVDYTLAHLGADHRERFYLTDKALPRLVSFMKSCGIEQSAFKGHKIESKATHDDIVVGSECMIRLEVLDRYREVTAHWKVGTTAPPMKERKPAPAAPPEDDIPF